MGADNVRVNDKGERLEWRYATTTAQWRKDIQAPKALLLYGYGAYGTPMRSYYQPQVLSLLDRGFVYAIAHVRGGGEFGEPWHDAARVRLRERAAGDLIAVAERLIDAVAVMDRLRTDGPWEGEQTHDSLRRYLLEETYELFDAIRGGDAGEVRDELGDVLLQVLFHARVAEEAALPARAPPPAHRRTTRATGRPGRGCGRARPGLPRRCGSRRSALPSGRALPAAPGSPGAGSASVRCSRHR